MLLLYLTSRRYAVGRAVETALCPVCPTRVFIIAGVSLAHVPHARSRASLLLNEDISTRGVHYEMSRMLERASWLYTIDLCLHNNR
jgi:hypothetical protein